MKLPAAVPMSVIIRKHELEETRDTNIKAAGIDQQWLDAIGQVQSLMFWRKYRGPYPGKIPLERFQSWVARWGAVSKNEIEPDAIYRTTTQAEEFDQIGQFFLEHAKQRHWSMISRETLRHWFQGWVRENEEIGQILGGTYTYRTDDCYDAIKDTLYASLKV